MKNKKHPTGIGFWWYLHKDNIMPVAKIVAVIAFLFLLAWGISALHRKSMITKFDSSTIAMIDTIIIVTEVNQVPEATNKFFIRAYNVHYSFEVNRKYFYEHENINAKFLTIQQNANLRKLKRGDDIIVNYDSKNPKQSRIIIE